MSVEKVYKVIEYLPIGANGVTGEAVVSEHPTPEGAVAAKDALYAQRPELVGCLAIRSGEATLKQETKGEDGDARPVAGGEGDGSDRVRRVAGNGGHRADVQGVREAPGRVRGAAVVDPVLAPQVQRP